MKRLLPFVALLTVTTLLLGQNYAPPAAQKTDEAKLKAIAAKTDRLGKSIASIRKQNVRDPALAEVEVYHKAAVWIVQHNEWYSKDSADWTLDVLDRGLVRAAQAASGEAPWQHRSGYVVARAYRSRVDGSVQPYAVSLPAEYGKDVRKKWRLDVVLHGRDSSISEVKFLHQHNGEKETPKDQDFVRIDIFGRGNNAYRWAGETDVEEAVNTFLDAERQLGRAQSIDLNRLVLRGFSMGGAGTWHLGLHRPDRWAVIGPGAGFTTTHGYIKGLPEQLPDYQERCLSIYDAVDYAENAFDVPVVAYSGDQDPQMAAARNIEEKLKAVKIPMTHIIAPGLAHSFPPEWQKKAEAEYSKYAGPGKGRKDYPEKVHFVTYTLKYPECAWVEILSLSRHYDRALVDAQRTETGFTVKTTNVAALRLGLQEAERQPLVVSIDGQEINTKPHLNQFGVSSVYLAKTDGQWQAVLPQRLATDRQRHLQKIVNLQGPIDDAFMEGFLCVRGTGKAWHEATQKYAEANLQRFREEWSQYLRGELPIKNDVEVTDEDLASKHLILFGDPASNALIGQVIDGLPLKWTKESIVLAGASGTAADHVPALIYPSPLNATRYVVLNSGHTFHAAEFRGTNAQLYPRLGDYALLKLAATEKDPLAVDVVKAGLFDEAWQAK
jgi:predicted esterase